uniref:Transport permease protein n=1 Tax=candidate division WOR-3 bacterium TaxID=2052148 RepID=A0A7C4GET9_UNCW3
MIDLRCIHMVWLRDIIRYFRERSQLYGSLVRPVLWLFILGMGLRGSWSGRLGPNPGTTYTQFIFPGIVAMTAIFTSIQSAISIIWDREFGFLKEILVAPVPRTSIAIGKGLAGTTLSLIQGIIIMALAPLVRVKIPLLNIIPLILVLAILSFALTGIGIVIAARMTSFQGFGTIMNFVIMPMWFLSGALFPLHGLPWWLNLLVRINPLTYGVDLVRRLVLGFSFYSPWFNIGFLVAFGCLTTALAVYFFNRGEY